MANRIPRITKRSVDAIKASGTDTVYWDGELTGFGLRVRRSGRKSYVVQTRIAGKLCWFTIGPHGPLNPDQARARALEILACAKKGIDPRDADARREAEPSMADLGRRFLEEYVPVHCKPSTREEYSRSVRLFVDPVIGELRVPEVQRKDIAALHHGLRDKPYQANRTLGVLSKMFSLAEVWGWRPDGSNPCRHVKRYKEHKRERFLSPEETERLGQVLRDVEEEMPSAVAAFRLLLLTAAECRRYGISAGSTLRTTVSSFPMPRPADGWCHWVPKPARCCQPFPVTRTIPGSSRAASPALTSPICNAPGGASASRRALRACGSTICATALPRARWLSAKA